jgi:hypothetical protein
LKIYLIKYLALIFVMFNAKQLEKEKQKHHVKYLITSILTKMNNLDLFFFFPMGFCFISRIVEDTRLRMGFFLTKPKNI